MFPEITLEQQQRVVGGSADICGLRGEWTDKRMASQQQTGGIPARAHAKSRVSVLVPARDEVENVPELVAPGGSRVCRPGADRRRRRNWC